MSASAFFKGLGAGLLVGTAVFMCSAKKTFGRKSVVGRALRSLGAVVEDVTDLFGL